MKLPQTKFTIGDYVVTKGSFNKKGLEYRSGFLEIVFYKISEIRTVTCYVGTQIIYFLKPMFQTYRSNMDFDSKQKFMDKSNMDFTLHKNSVSLKELSEPEIESFEPNKLPERIFKKS